MAREAVQSLDRGLRLLELLAATDEPVSVTDLADALGVARPVVYRLLATLESHGLARAFLLLSAPMADTSPSYRRRTSRVETRRAVSRSDQTGTV